MLLLLLHLNARNAACIGVKIQQSLGRALLVRAADLKAVSCSFHASKKMLGYGRRCYKGRVSKGEEVVLSRRRRSTRDECVESSYLLFRPTTLRTVSNLALTW